MGFRGLLRRVTLAELEIAMIDALLSPGSAPEWIDLLRPTFGMRGGLTIRKGVPVTVGGAIAGRRRQHEHA